MLRQKREKTGSLFINAFIYPKHFFRRSSMNRSLIQKIWCNVLSLQRIPLIGFICILSFLWYFSLKVKSVVFLIPSLVVCLLVYFFPKFFRVIRFLAKISIIAGIVIFYLMCLLVVHDTLLGLLGILALFLLVLNFWDRERQKCELSPIHGFWKKAIPITGILVFLGLGICDILASKELAKITQKAKEMEIPLDLKALKKVSGQEDIQEEKNAGPIVLACSQMLRDTYQKWLSDMATTNPGSVWETMKSSVRKSLFSKKGIHEIPEGQILNTLEWDALKKFLDSTEKIRTILEAAMEFEQIQIPIEFPATEIGMMETKIAHLYDIRNCMNYFSLHADYYCHTKQEKEFIAVLSMMIKLANLPAREPFIISNIIKVVLQKNVLKKMEKGMSVFSISLQEKTLRNWQKQIEPWCDFAQSNLDIPGVSEFLWVYHTAQKSRWDFIFPGENVHGFFLPRAYFIFSPSAWTKIDLAYLMEKQLEKIQWSREEKSIREFLAIKEKEVSYFYPLTNLVLPAWGSIYQKNFETLTLSRCAWIALETVISVKENQDTSNSLESLFKKDIPYLLDPFTTQKLSYEKSSKACFIHGTAKTKAGEGKEEALIGITITIENR